MSASVEADGVADRRAWLRPFVPSLLLIAVLLAARTALLLAYPADFAGLSGAEVFGAYVRGLRFDLAITTQLVGIPLALSLLPAAFARRRLWQLLCGWLAFVGVLIGLILSIGDFIYFPDVHRHIGGDLANSWGSDWDTLVRSLFDFPLVLAGFVGLLAGLVYMWSRFLRRGVPRIPNTSGAWVRYALFAAALGVIAKGFHAGDFLPVHAYGSGSVAAGDLALNGPFSALHSIDDRGPMAFDGDLDEAVAEFRGRFALRDETWHGSEVPLQRDPIPAPAGAGHEPRPNVVLLVLESFDAVVTDALRTRVGLDPLGATPVFDALVGEGTLYTRFYANGQRSLEGLTALLASFPTLPGIPYLGDGTAGVEKSFLGHLARTQGYRSHMVRSAAKESFDLGTVAERAGFDTYAGAQDIVARPSHTEAPAGKWGAWDFDSLRYLHGILAEEREPFVAMFFGSSTHTPFASPGPEWQRFDPDTERGRFRNAVHYVDWAVGRYLEMAREAGYYEDTIWIITSDQGSRMIDAVMSPDRFWIPALIIGPGVPAGVVDDQVASLMDLLPTIMDLAGWSVSHASFGESLLRDREERAILRAGELVIRIGEDGWIIHSLLRPLGGEGPPAVRSRLEDRLRSEAQAATELFYQNRIYRGPEGGALVARALSDPDLSGSRRSGIGPTRSGR